MHGRTLQLIFLQVLMASVLGCTQRGPHGHQYELAWHGTSSDLMGSEQPSEIDSSTAFANSSWQVLADDDEGFAIAIQEPSTGVTLIFSMRRPKGPLRWSTSTSDGSLEAWLHRAYVPERQLVDFDEVERFWRRVPRAADPTALAMLGSASIEMSGKLPKSITVDLRSLAPVPLDRDFYETANSPWKSKMWLRERASAPDRRHATIKGRFTGYWHDLGWRPPI